MSWQSLKISKWCSSSSGLTLGSEWVTEFEGYGRLEYILARPEKVKGEKNDVFSWNQTEDRNRRHCPRSKQKVRKSRHCVASLCSSENWKTRFPDQTSDVRRKGRIRVWEEDTKPERSYTELTFASLKVCVSLFVYRKVEVKVEEDDDFIHKAIGHFALSYSLLTLTKQLQHDVKLSI